MQELKNLATFRRYLWRDPALLVVTGECASLMEGAAVYNRRYGIESPVPQQHQILTRLLGATGLAAVSLADRESWGWSIALPESETGYFVGVEPEGMICVTPRATPEENQLAVIQRQKAGQRQTQSHITPPDGDPVHLVEHYFEAALQIPTRIAVENGTSKSSGNRAVLVQNLPGGRFEEVASLDEARLIELLYQQASTKDFLPMGEVLLFYECRCHDETVLKMLADLPDATRRELWGDKDELEIECPRCGRKFIVTRRSPQGKES